MQILRLSLLKTFNIIEINNLKIKYYKDIIIKMPKCQMDFLHTIIYKFCCMTNIKDTYVGHTTNFTQRKNQHKTSVNDESCKRKVPGYSQTR